MFDKMEAAKAKYDEAFGGGGEEDNDKKEELHRKFGEYEGKLEEKINDHKLEEVAILDVKKNSKVLWK